MTEPLPGMRFFFVMPHSKSVSEAEVTRVGAGHVWCRYAGLKEPGSLWWTVEDFHRKAVLPYLPVLGEEP